MSDVLNTLFSAKIILNQLDKKLKILQFYYFDSKNKNMIIYKEIR